MHMIAWDTVKISTKEGGLRIKHLRRKNRAFIMKPCWVLLTKPEWVKCLRAKYRCGDGTIPMIRLYQCFSSLEKLLVCGRISRKENKKRQTH